MTGKFNLKDIIDMEEFQKIQDDIAYSTGTAIITTDCHGKPLTSHSMCTDFCRNIREKSNLRDLCEKCDSIGGLESVRRGSPYIYKCHMGIIDFAIPIIFKGEYLGSLMAGQVLTEESKLEALESIIEIHEKAANKDKIMDKYKNIPVIPYDKIQAIAKMIFSISNYIVDQGALKMLQQELSEKNVRFMKAEKIQTELEKELKDSQLKALQSQINPHFLFNTLNSISALALIEEAPRTKEVVCNLSEILRYTLKKTSAVVDLEDEINYITSYLNLQKIRFGSRLEFHIDVDDKYQKIKIPFMIIQPFVENSIIHGIGLKEDGGLIKIKAYKSCKALIISIEDNGVGIDEDKLELISGGKASEKDSSHGIGIVNVKQRMNYFYGKNYSVDITSSENKGTKVKIILFNNI
ncbi:sensor histidine kinase [Clostridium pasteurianum]|uniref:Histidine kinase n=1 Tax=Clostridium pasteurianum BC1 TaxID=86416 RepID=R4K2H4_CLOPA|nr:histidine kinase [Clostridium pasteurianum BC1]